MNSKELAQRNKQRERQQRGNDFQEEIRKSWQVAGHPGYRIRLKDGRGGTQPGDEVVLLEDGNILAELKRTAGMQFKLSFLRPDQITGLLEFDGALERNFGLVFASFLHETKGVDEAYVFRLRTALLHMKRKQREHVTIDELRLGAVPAARLNRVESVEPYYDLKELIACYKSL